MLKEQFVDQSLNVLNVVGEKFVDVAGGVSDFAREDTTKSVAKVAVFVVVFGAMDAGTAILGEESDKSESSDKKPKD